MLKLPKKLVTPQTLTAKNDAESHRRDLQSRIAQSSQADQQIIVEHVVKEVDQGRPGTRKSAQQRKEW